MGAEEAIKATIVNLVDAWNQNNISAFAMLFTEDASYVSGTGLHLRGREAIREGLSSNEIGSGEQGSVDIAGSSIKLIRADIAVVHYDWQMTSDSDLLSRKGVITQVMVNDGEGWRIAALQNTLKM